MIDTPKITVMQICGASDAGGAEAFYLRVVKAMANHRRMRVIPVVKRGSWLASRLHDAGIIHHTLPFGGRLDFITGRRLKQLIVSTKPDIAQGWMNRATSFMPRGMVPTVGRLGGYYDLKYYQGIDWLMGNTPDICRYIIAGGFPEDHVVYMPNFVDMPSQGFKEQGVAVRARYAIPDHVPVLLLAGRLHPNKGFDVAIRALEKLPERTHLLIAGEGPEEKSLRAIAASLGIANRVHFLGWVNGITPLCAAADIFVVPSRHEPLGNVVLEAWAHAMPVVATAAEGPRQTISDGRNGLLVPIDHVDALADAIRNIITSRPLANSLAEQGALTLEIKFSQDAIMERLLDFYEKVKQS